MIFRAPAGHWILSKDELQKIMDQIKSDDPNQALEFLQFCHEEAEFYDDIRRQTELKKILREEGEDLQAQSLERKILHKVKERQEFAKLFKENYLK